MKREDGFILNKVLTILAIIVSILGILIIVFSMLSKTKIERSIKSTVGIAAKYTSETEENNEWDISKLGDGSIIAVYDSDTCTLTISGTGEMKNWTSSASMPWNSVSKQIKIVDIKEGVTSIGDFSFWGCSELIDVRIAEGVEYISISAFENCTSLTEIELPSTVTNVEGDTNEYDPCFEKCSNLKNIKVNVNNETYCDIDGVLYSKDKTKMIRYPQGREESTYCIGSQAIDMGVGVFQDCNNLKNMEIPSNIKYIGYKGFYGCSNLENIIIQEGAEVIRRYAFGDCSKLDTITIPSTIKDIENNVFDGCTSLIDIKVNENNETFCDIDGVLHSKDKRELLRYPQGKQEATYFIQNEVEKIGYYAMTYCNNLKEIVITNSVSVIDYYAFNGCNNLININIPEGVREIGIGAFYGCKGLKSVTIPSSVTKIEDSLFMRCSNLEEVILPNSIKEIGPLAFYECTSLKKITIPESVEKIGDRAYGRCTKLIEINIPNTVKTIANRVLEEAIITKFISIEKNECELLEILNRVQNAEDIMYSNEEFVFENCVINNGKVKINEGETYCKISVPSGKLSGLTCIISYNEWDISAKEDGSVKAILDYQEEILKVSGIGDMKNWWRNQTPWDICKIFIKNVEIEEGITNIGDYAFSECAELQNVIISEGVKSIGRSAFSNCNGLGKLEIPSSVEKIEIYSFNECEKLVNIDVDSDNSSYCDDNGIVYTKDMKQIICYPAGKSEETYILPDGVTTIINGAFSGCYKLKSLEIPESVINIEIYGIQYCRNLKIRCYKDSVAEAYAIEKKIPYEVIYYLSSTEIEIDELNSIIRKIQPKTTIQELKTIIQSKKSYEIIDKEGNVIQDDSTIVKVGYKLKLENNQIYTLIVTGDCNGDGEVTVSGDIIKMNAHRLSGKGLSAEYFLAADVDQDGEIKVKDIILINAIRLKQNKNI